MTKPFEYNGKPYPERDDWGRERTPYAVHCDGPWDLPGNGHGLVYLTEAEYDRQMSNPDATWRCPICRYEAQWDDDNWERACEEMEAADAKSN